MRYILPIRPLLAFLLTCSVGLTPESPSLFPAPPTAIASYKSVIPAERLKENRWKNRFESLQPQIESGDYDLVFIGDSITQNWDYAGHEVWSRYYGRRKALNLGFSGDHTEHVIWRLTHGELAGLRPKVFVLLIGTNNSGHRKDPPKETAAGIRRIIDLIQFATPESKILLLSVLPRGETPDGPLRQLNQKINPLIQAYADGQRVVWMDVWNLFLTPEGKLTRDVTPDFLHPQTKGYEMLAAAMEPTLKQMLGE